jgi:GNAT superfamily N-acetyltransferase
MITKKLLDNHCTYLLHKYPELNKLVLEHCTTITGEDYIYLGMIVIDNGCRNKGIGTKIMSELIQLANKYNVQIRLWSTNIYGCDILRLQKFYLNLNFKHVDDNDKEMIYYPINNILDLNK